MRCSGSARAVSMQMGMRALAFRSRASSRPLSPGIITSRITTSNARPRMAARASRRRGRRHAEAVLGQVAAEQVADLWSSSTTSMCGALSGSGALAMRVGGLCLPSSVFALRSAACACRVQLNQRLDARAIRLSQSWQKGSAGLTLAPPGPDLARANSMRLICNAVSFRPNGRPWR